MTTINTTDDLLALLDDNPEFLEAVRNKILTNELLALPAVFGAFAAETRARLSTLEKDVDVLKSDVAVLKEDVAVLKEDVSDLKEDVSDLKGDVGILKGIGLETRLADKGLAQIASAFMMRRLRIVRLAEHNRASERFNEDVWSALDNGMIDNSEYERLLDTDLIVQGTANSGSVAYCAAEASFTAETGDIEKVSSSSTILRKLFPGAEVYAAVYYMEVSDGVEESAERRGITLIKGRLP